MTVKAALRAMSRSQGADEIATFIATITSDADAVRDFDGFIKSAGQTDQSSSRELLTRFRTLCDKVEKKQVAQADFSDVFGHYNAVVDLMNSYQ